MNIAGLVRGADVVIGNLVKKEKEIITKKGCKIHIPVHYEESGLVSLGSETYILGIFAWIFEDKYYAFNSTVAKMRVTPTTVNVVTHDDVDYYEFYFEPGSCVIADKMLIVDDTVAYAVYDEVIAKGRVPWYMSYEDKCKLFRSSPKHAGMRVGANKAVMEMIVANTCRDPNDMVRYYRQILLTDNKEQPAHVPFNSVIYGATNTVARLVGSYFELGVMSSLNNPSTRTERIETILRRA